MTDAAHDTGPARPDDVLIDVDRVTKTFDTSDGERPVLDAVSLQVYDGELVALLGKSGSGKSTLLRCMAGLLAPSKGAIRYRGEALTGRNPGTAMVFQTFALLPWLTVQQNVELGLEAKGVGRHRRRVLAEEAIDLIGLDGFESAYPKELSGGMRQRVGFARALVVEPDVLLMDEPFSALDVLTAENLRGELLELWATPELPIRSIVLVTHNIEEAVLLADRVVVLGSDPGRVRFEMAVELPRPRDRTSPVVEEHINRIYEVMTGRPATVVDAGPADGPATPGSVPLPHANVDALSGLAEVLVGQGPAALADTAELLAFEVDDLLPLVDALDLLAFVDVVDGCVELTALGQSFATADIQASKELFARAALDRAPLVRAIAAGVDKAPEGALDGAFFRSVLRRSFSEVETERQLDVATDWGRYAELFAYESDRDRFLLDPDRSVVPNGTAGSAPSSDDP